MINDIGYSQPPMFSEIAVANNPTGDKNEWYLSSNTFWTGATVAWKVSNWQSEHELWHPGYASGGDFFNDQGLQASAAGWQKVSGVDGWVGYPTGNGAPAKAQPSGGGKKFEWYRTTATAAQVGMALFYMLQEPGFQDASSIMFGGTIADADKVVNYIDRWMNENIDALWDKYVPENLQDGYRSGGSTESNCTTNMWNAYRNLAASGCWYDCDDQK